MLQIVLLFIGVAGLFKRKIKISSKRELSGTPVIFLSLFYLAMAALPFLVGTGYDLITVGVIALVTLPVVIFAKGQPVLPKGEPTVNPNIKP